MRFWLVAGWLALLSCSGADELRTNKSPDAEPARSFRHAECAEWTDWQTFCSAPMKGDTSSLDLERSTCVRSSNQLDKPEPVVCLRWTRAGDGIGLESYGAGESKYCKLVTSVGRSCAARADQHCVEVKGGRPSPRACSMWQDRHPFDGRAAQDIDHPWCLRWESRQQVCTKDNEEMGLRCTARFTAAAPEFFHCTSWNVPAEACALWTDGTKEWDHDGCVHCTRRILYDVAQSPVKFVRCLRTVK